MLQQEALGTGDRRYIYRLEDGISWLLPALAMVCARDANISGLDPARREVQTFYDEYGWVRNNAGIYNDTSEFTDVRETSQNYADACNLRVERQLRGGSYLLDAASGAIPHASYLRFSSNYHFRICVDFSIKALREAQTKLGERGLYVLADITGLPFGTDSIDDCISLHTLYHVPAPDQAAAVAELVRVVRPGGRVVIVSKWSSSPLMSFLALVRRFLGAVKRLITGAKDAREEARKNGGPAPSLYYSPQNYQWFVEHLRRNYDVNLRLWSSTSTSFHQKYFSNDLKGKLIAKIVLTLEHTFERFLARFGEYPMFVIAKHEIVSL
jgi:ubiquinone/menaquinone biosynthesis C-methylase UbiE